MFMKNKPKAKILILDSKEGFAKDQPFMLGWSRLYNSQIPAMKMEGMPDSANAFENPDMIEWVAGSLGGTVGAVDADTMTVTTKFGDTFHGDVINFFSAAKSGKAGV